MATMKEGDIYAELVLRSGTGASLIGDAGGVTPASLHMFQAGADSAPELEEKLTEAGFTVLASSRFGMSISGPEKLFKEFFKAKIVERPVQMFFGGDQQYETNGFFMDDPPRIPSRVAKLAESLYVPRRGWFLAGEGAMPATSYYALRPPADISQLTNADAAHARGFRGNGVQVAMVDSGFIANHDYYAGRGYNITVHAAVGSVTVDEYGHGTGIASNLLAIAPDCNFHFYKMSTASQWASLAAFRMAVQDGASVITCSWGQMRDAVLEAEIVAAVAAGVTVIFACGNGGAVGWPGCMPDVISVGGAFPIQSGGWEASSYASSGVNGLYPTRHCPDFSAIVGHAPKGIFIVQPTMAGAIFDGSFGGGVFPNGDETAVDDGWLVASGTSSAAPMVAGAAALLLEARSSLTPLEIKQTLADTCIDVMTGASASGETAGIGPDSATGAGMIHIGDAVDRIAPVVVCPRAPLEVECVRAPVQACLRAPVVECLRAPIECARAPLIECLRAPVQCLRAPMIACLRAPIEECVRAPILECGVAPVRLECPPGPIDGCYAGPWKRLDPRERLRDPRVLDPRIREPRIRDTGRLRPIIMMVDEADLAAWQSGAGASQDDAHQLAMRAASEAYYATLRELGMSDEYTDFPDVEGCRRGPFDPQAE